MSIPLVVTKRYEVQRSHHDDNPLLRPTGSKSRQKVMRLYKQWHRPISKRFIKPPYSISRATSIDSECSAFSAKTGKITLQPVLINKSKFLKATHFTEIRKNERPRSMVVKASNWWSWRASQHPAGNGGIIPLGNPVKYHVMALYL